MRVLITKEFNAAVARLGVEAQHEIFDLYRLATQWTYDDFFESPLVTRVQSRDDELYTLRTEGARVFCSFDGNRDLLFVDATAAISPIGETGRPQKEVSLFGNKGEPKVYISVEEEESIYSFDGRPLAYLDGTNIYGFNGHHLGWFEDGIVWNHQGERLGFTAKTCPAFRKFEPFKGFKRFKPFKAFRQFAPARPLKRGTTAGQDLLKFMEAGAHK